MFKAAAITSVLLVASSMVFAQEKTKVTQTDKSQVSNQPLDSSQQKFWQLSDSEWAKYQEVKPIAKAIGQAETTPVEVLGIFASSELERQKYAKAYVEAMDAYTSNVLEFQRVVANLQNEKYLNIPMLDPAAVNQLIGSPVTASDKIQFFTKIGCQSCDLMLLKLIRQVNFYDANLDIFFEDATPEQIQEYALNRRIPEKLVQSGKITLNPDRGYVAKYQISTPAAYVSRNGGSLEHHDPDL